ncbi:MAG: DNA polymerase III subunit alpha [Pseudomonadales bacterium]
MAPPFIHLKVHSEFSLVDGLVRIKPLVKTVAELGMPAVALTDVSNFYGLIKFYKAAMAAGIKPIVGADFWLRESDDEPVSTLTLLAQNEAGYRNMRELISKAWLDGQSQGEAHIQRAWLEQHNEGVIVLSGGKFGDVGQALLKGNEEGVTDLLDWWQRFYPDRYYLELQRTGREQDEDYVHKTVAVAALRGLPVVATNDVRFLDTQEYEAHEARVCIHDSRALDDSRRVRRYSDQQYLRSSEEMAELFADIPEALENTLHIARRCNVEIELGKYYLPDYPIPAGMTLDEFFRKICHEGLTERLDFLFDRQSDIFAEKETAYRARLDFELETIIQMGFPGYFLIVMDFIKWAKDNDIPVGPGRGSGAGSLVAYSLLITDLDPLQYDLLFERFLNPERVSMPDFDVDFCMDGRDRVISYVADTYGRKAVSQIVTFGTMAAKAVVRDVARVQGKSYGLADRLSKMIPFEVGITLEKAFEQEEILREFLDNDGQAQEIWDMAVQLEGVTRGVGKHAGGVVIAPTELTDFSPLYCDESGQGLVTQYDKNDVEDVGLVKFDFLGLRTLTIIDWAVKMINRRQQSLGEAEIEIISIPLDDRQTFEMLKRAETTAVFQLESRGMKELIKQLLPDNFEEIIALVALFRPGPLQSGMVDDFIARKHGRAQVAYPDAQYQHESLIPILEPTYGVIVYQEQVMQIAQVLAGYTLGAADMLRRAMGKKNAEEMAKQREFFESGAAEQGIDANLAMRIFDLVEKFAGYGFNKSHSAAYALVSYQTAWLKTHFPAQFMAATLSSDMDKTDKVVTFIEECRAMKLELQLPDVNSGEFMFTVNDESAIVYGLGAIKGLGEGPVESLIEAREKAGPFTDIFDFCARTDPRKVNKRALEALIRSGAFDRLGIDRAILMAALPDAVKAAEQSVRNTEAGMDDMFGDKVATPIASDNVYEAFLHVPAWGGKQRLEGEKETLGLYVTGHPIDEYESEMKHLVANRIADLRAEKHAQNVVGLIIDMRIVKTRRGDMGFATLDDRTGRIEVGFFSEALNEFRDKLVKDRIVLVEGVVAVDDRSGGLKVRASSVIDIDEARNNKASAVVLNLTNNRFPANLKDILVKVKSEEPANACALWVQYQSDGAQGRIRMGGQWQLYPSDEVIASLREQLGKDHVYVEYDRPVRQ